MLAMALALGLFGFWALLGRAMLALLPGQRPALQDLLLAPAAGIAGAVLPVHFLSRAGLPVGTFGIVLAVVLAVAAGALLLGCRPAVPWRRCAGLLLLLLLALFLTGGPMLEFGFGWLGVCNGDMASYCGSARWFLDHGYADFPPAQAIVDGRDASHLPWMLHVLGLVRAGSELLLAWVASVTGLLPDQAFMPLLVSFHLALVCATGGLVCSGDRPGRSAWWACLLVALSPLTNLGTFYQLLGQVPGLALLCALTVVLLQPRTEPGWRAIVRDGLLLAVLGSGLLVVYPEVVPFLGGGFVLYLLAAALRRQAHPGRLLGGLGVAVLGVLLLFRERIVEPLAVMVHHAVRAGITADGMSRLFPMFLKPAGVCYLWGLLPLGGPLPGGAWTGAGVVLGVGLLLAVVVAALLLLRRLEPVAAVTLTLVAVGGVFLVRANGFGLFKLSMYIQPFLLGTIVLGWTRLVRGKLLHAGGLLLLALLGLPAQRTYSTFSRGEGPLAEVPHAAKGRLADELRQLERLRPDGTALVAHRYPCLARLEMSHLPEARVSMPGRQCLIRARGLHGHPMRTFLSPDTFEAALALAGVLEQRCREHQIDLLDPAAPGAAARFVLNTFGRSAHGPPDYDLVLALHHDLDVVNRRHAPPARKDILLHRRGEEARNWLVWVPSDLGEHYEHLRGRISLYKMEPDPMLPGHTFAAQGRYALFEVVKPTPGARLCLELSTSPGPGSDRCLPPAAVVGTERVLLAAVGRGSARLFSAPLTPRRVEGYPFLLLDLGVDGGQFSELDGRRIVAFTRAISLVSAEEHARLRPPSWVQAFPADLAHPDLEYSGIYEDGWASEAAYLWLSQPAGAGQVAVRGLVPQIDTPSFHTTLRLLVDGREVARRVLGCGPFEITAPVPSDRCPPAGRRKVELHFSAVQALPAGDGRPAAAQLFVVGFEKPPTQAHQPR